MGCILGTTIGSYLFFLSLLGLLDPCFAIGGFLVRVAKMLFVDIIGPWAYILNFFSRTRTGFNLESFLNRVFSWIIGSIVIDKVLKNLDLLEILAPIEPPGNRYQEAISRFEEAIAEALNEPVVLRFSIVPPI